MAFRRVLTAGLVSVGLLLVGAARAPAIVNGTPDHTHPYVGALFLIDSQGDTYFLCTGSLLTPHWFLTGGHCVGVIAPGDRAFVSFAQQLSGPFDPYTGLTGPQPDPVVADAWTTCPGFAVPGNNIAVDDVGLVHLTSGVTDLGSASLPAENADSALVHGQGLTVVGYGQDSLVHKIPTWTGTRQFTHVVFNNLTPGFLDAQADYAVGAPAGGDSGAPAFQDDSSNVILGMVSWGRMGGAGGLGHYQRVDTPAILDWLLQRVQPAS